MVFDYAMMEVNARLRDIEHSVAQLETDVNILDNRVSNIDRSLAMRLTLLEQLVDQLRMNVAFLRNENDRLRRDINWLERTLLAVHPPPAKAPPMPYAKFPSPRPDQ